MRVELLEAQAEAAEARLRVAHTFIPGDKRAAYEEACALAEEALFLPAAAAQPEAPQEPPQEEMEDVELVDLRAGDVIELSVFSAQEGWVRERRTVVSNTDGRLIVREGEREYEWPSEDRSADKRDVKLVMQEPPQEEPDPLLGLPPNLARVLRDPTITIDRDHEIRLADGRTLFEHIHEWRNAPSNTASADLPQERGGEQTKREEKR